MPGPNDRDFPPEPTHTPDAAKTSAPTTGETLLDKSELQDFTNKPYADLTVDSEPDHLRDSKIPYDTLATLTAPRTNDEPDIGSWDDLRRLSTPPPRSALKGGKAKVFVCIQHPSLLVMDGDQTIGQFENGYLVTDDDRLIKNLMHPSHRYVKLLDMGEVKA